MLFFHGLKFLSGLSCMGGGMTDSSSILWKGLTMQKKKKKNLTIVQSMEKKKCLWKTTAVFKIYLDCDFRTLQSLSSLSTNRREAHIAARKDRDRKDSTGSKRWIVPVPLPQVMQGTSFKQSLKRWVVPLGASGSCTFGRWGTRLKNPEKSGKTHVKQKNQFSGKLQLS